MAVSKIQNGIKVSIIGRLPDANTTITAGDAVTFDTGNTINGTIIGMAPIFAGHYKCIITNVWKDADNGHIKFTIFNPSSETRILGTTQLARVLVIYR